MPEQKITGPDPWRLAQFFDTEERLAQRWSDADLADALRHQLNSDLPARLRQNLSQTQEALDGQDAISAAAKATLADVLFGTHTPVATLVLLKDFAKSNIGSNDHGLPEPVASVLYYDSIASALVNQQARITELNDQQLISGIRFLLEQVWIDDRSRNLLLTALKLIYAKPEP